MRASQGVLVAPLIALLLFGKRTFEKSARALLQRVLVWAASEVRV